MKGKKNIVAFVSFIILCLAVLQVVVSNSLSTTGITLSDLQQQLNLYKRENAILQEKLLTMSSLTEIASKAATLGFVDTKSQLVVGSALPIAIKP